MRFRTSKLGSICGSSGREVRGGEKRWKRSGGGGTRACIAASTQHWRVNHGTRQGSLQTGRRLVDPIRRPRREDDLQEHQISQLQGGGGTPNPEEEGSPRWKGSGRGSTGP